MTRPDLAFDMVRPGIAVYGLNPMPERGDMGLIPAMTLKCPVSLVQIDEGRRRGVLRPHLDRRPRHHVALMPIGYADGVFRALSGRMKVLINGRLRRNVGRICMDQFVVDLGPGPVDVADGDEAILFGPGTPGSRRRRTGPNCSAPSTTRSSPARGAGSARTYRGRPATGRRRER